MPSKPAIVQTALGPNEDKVIVSHLLINSKATYYSWNGFEVSFTGPNEVTGTFIIEKADAINGGDTRVVIASFGVPSTAGKFDDVQHRALAALQAVLNPPTISMF